MSKNLSGNFEIAPPLCHFNVIFYVGSNSHQGHITQNLRLSKPFQGLRVSNMLESMLKLAKIC